MDYINIYIILAPGKFDIYCDFAKSGKKYIYW
jgi:hypothetical protein